MAGNDFVMVQLTPAGEALAGGHPIQISVGTRTFRFVPAEPGQPYPALRVEKSYEWRAILSKQVTPSGDAIFELAADQLQKPALVVASHPPQPDEPEETK